MDELHALVLAGGSGSRFGGQKLLAPWGAGHLMHAALDAAAQAPVTGITVVTGAEAEGLVASCGEWARRAGETRLRMIHAVHHREGMAASLRAGIDAVPPSAVGCFVILGDMPRLPAEVLSQLPEALGGNRLAAAPVCQGRRGHPVLISRRLFPQILALEGDRGAKFVLDQLGDRLGLVQTSDDGVLFDVDRVEDLERSLAGPATQERA